MIRIHKIGLIAILLASTVPLAARAGSAAPIQTGTFHGQVHSTSGRAAIYQEASGKRLLRLTKFKTSNGPDVHVILIAAKDAKMIVRLRWEAKTSATHHAIKRYTPIWGK